MPEKKIVGCILVDHVNTRELAKKKNDWVLYAYIIQRAGGSSSVEEIKSKLTAWRNRNANSRRITQVMHMHHKKGFNKEEERWVSSKYVSIWSFTGELPQINRKTLQSWEKRLSPKGDK